MINERDAVTRSKREVRRKRDCDLTAKHCEFLLQTVQNYLVALSNKLPVTGGDTSVSADILKCLECKKLMNSLDENDKDHTPQSKDQYFPHDYAEQNRSSDFGPTVIKLLDETKNGSKAEVKQTEAARIQPVETSSVMNNLSQDVTNPSSKGASISETTTINIPISIDHTDSNGSQRIYVNDTDINNSTINDKLPDSTPAENHSRVTKIQSDESVLAISSIDQQRVTSKTVTSVKPWFTTEPSSIKTQYTITGDEQSRKTIIAADSTRTTEMGIRNIIDLTKQITENVMSVPANDVTGIDGGTVRPSFEGHPENRLAAATNGAFQEEYEKGLVK